MFWMPGFMKHGVAPIADYRASRLMSREQPADTVFSVDRRPMATGSSRAVRVSQPSLTPADAVRPRDGDVIVSRESGSGVKYTVRQVPGEVQLLASVRDEAIRLARGFAQTAAVDVWFSDHGGRQVVKGVPPKGSAS